MSKRLVSHLFLLAALLCMSMVLIAGCGKVGDPKPRQSSRSFVWQQVEIVPLANCLEVRAVMSGVYTNLDRVILELSGGAPEDCPGCPFQANEFYSADNLSDIFNPQNGTLRFTYCPLERSTIYRARLIGTNIYDTSRHAVSKELMVVMP